MKGGGMVEKGCEGGFHGAGWLGCVSAIILVQSLLVPSGSFQICRFMSFISGMFSRVIVLNVSSVMF